MQSSPERQPDVRCKMTDLVGPVTMQVRPATSASTPLSGGRCRVRHFWQSGDMRQSCTSANLAVTLCHDNHAECLLCDSAKCSGSAPAATHPQRRPPSRRTTAATLPSVTRSGAGSSYATDLMTASLSVDDQLSEAMSSTQVACSTGACRSISDCSSACEGLQADMIHQRAANYGLIHKLQVATMI